MTRTPEPSRRARAQVSNTDASLAQAATHGPTQVRAASMPDLGLATVAA
jgi:hypothetical protein